MAYSKTRVRAKLWVGKVENWSGHANLYMGQPWSRQTILLLSFKFAVLLLLAKYLHLYIYQFIIIFSNCPLSQCGRESSGFPDKRGIFTEVKVDRRLKMRCGVQKVRVAS